MTQLVREVRQQKPNTRLFVNERLAAAATGPLFRVSHLEKPPAPVFKKAGLKAACARLGGCVFKIKVGAIRCNSIAVSDSRRTPDPWGRQCDGAVSLKELLAQRPHGGFDR